MEVFEGDFRESPRLLSECSMTIGNFDGVHLGHRLLIEEMKRGGQQHQIPAAVLTFSPHPSQVLGGSPVGKIYPMASQVRLMRELGVSHLFVQQFDISFSQMTSEDFLRQYLFRLWDPRVLVVGDDFGFGQSKSGGRELLGEECQSRGCHWRPCKTLKDTEGRRVSSSLAREALKTGDISALNQILGSPYFVEGLVVSGQKLGRTLGFPTANILVEDRLYPKAGVYYGRVTSLENSPWGLVNIGVRPTVSSPETGSSSSLESPSSASQVDGGGALSVECHILNFSGDLYGKPLTFQFEGRLRDEIRFSGKVELVAQIRNDIGFVEKIQNEAHSE